MTTRTLAAIATVLGAAWWARAQDPAGFTTYLIGFMTQAEGRLPDGSTQPQLQKAHVANLDAMWKEGLLVASGPIGDTGDLRGVVIFRGDRRAAVEARVAEDPLVKAGFLQVSMGPWLAPVGIGDEYKKWAATNPSVLDRMRTYQLVLLKTIWGAARLTEDEQRTFVQQIDQTVKAGKLAVAGPVSEGSDLAWVLVFTADAAEADALAASISFVRAGKMLAARHPWMVAEGVLAAGFKVPVPWERVNETVCESSRPPP